MYGTTILLSQISKPWYYVDPHTEGLYLFKQPDDWTDSGPKKNNLVAASTGANVNIYDNICCLSGAARAQYVLSSDKGFSMVGWGYRPDNATGRYFLSRETATAVQGLIYWVSLDPPVWRMCYGSISGYIPMSAPTPQGWHCYGVSCTMLTPTTIFAQYWGDIISNNSGTRTFAITAGVDYRLVLGRTMLATVRSWAGRIGATLYLSRGMNTTEYLSFFNATKAIYQPQP